MQTLIFPNRTGRTSQDPLFYRADKTLIVDKLHHCMVI